MHTPMRKWSEIYPHGRHIYYEGDDPKGFVEEIKAKFNFDPSKDPHWGKNDEEDEHNNYLFFCPGHLLDEIYSSKYPMGS